MKGWESIEDAKENKTIIEGKVNEENKGGVVANAFGIRVFIPASQTGHPARQPLSQLVGQTARFRITEDQPSAQARGWFHSCGTAGRASRCC